jgi:hypothetical protein
VLLNIENFMPKILLSRKVIYHLLFGFKVIKMLNGKKIKHGLDFSKYLLKIKLNKKSRK